MNNKGHFKKTDWIEIQTRISPIVKQTPVISNENINDLYGLEVFFKCENLQNTGAFKIRGAANVVLKAQREQKLKNGIIGSSSGNHGIALATLGKALDIPCVVVVPPICPKMKVKKIKDLGAEIIFTPGMNYADRERIVNEIASVRGLMIVSNGNSLDCIQGHGTMALELSSQVVGDPLDAILVPASTGGMLAGCALATKDVNPTCKIIAVEPKGKCLADSLRAKTMLWPGPRKYLETRAEGLKTQAVFPIPFDICCDHVEPEVLTVSDEEMIRGIQLAAAELKLVLEMPAGAALAAAFQVKKRFPNVKRLGIILCGGNIDMEVLMDSLVAFDPNP
ncbi:uncharacterized protein LOC131881968 [Tigriopus californicus]|nr:uncharacterized protein LOC131881968 [Tigriopus californicus]|eukprot:TCALIF_09785-PA protein Name:"Similar to SERR Serine racemase (Oryza sativa subsp. japonica)" AED:0.04 eAED:0.05 QI:0/0.66/0/1/1/0.75/4/0/335